MTAPATATREPYRKRAHGKLYRAEKPTAGGATHVGTLTLPDGTVWILEAKVVEANGAKHFDITPYHALLRNAKVDKASNVDAIPPDLISLMEAPFDDAIPPEPS